MTFQVSEYVFHRHCGVCLIQGIMPLPGDDSGSLYYVLSPLFGDDKGNIVRVPVDFAGSLRKPINKEEALEIVKSWPSPDRDWYITDSKARRTSYEEALKNGTLMDLAPLLEGAIQRKKKDGHLNSMDSQFVNRAEPLLYGALSLALEINYSDVPKFIADHLA